MRAALAAEGLEVSSRRGPTLPPIAGEIAAQLDGLLQSRGRYQQALHVLGELKDTIACDISLARAEIGYDPQVSLFEGMRASVRWCLERGLPDLMATLLITGGSGYFGSVLADQALARGDAVRIFDLNEPGELSGPVDFVQGDVRDRDALRSACEGIDAVLHNVAQVPLAKDRELFWSVNVVGTANLLLAGA